MKKKGYAKLIGFIFLLSLRAAAQEFPVLVVEKKTYERLGVAQKEFRAAVASGDSLQVASACYVLGKRYAELDDYQKGNYFLFRALNTFVFLGLSKEVGKIYVRLAEWSYHRKELPKALMYARRAHPYVMKENESKRVANMYKLLADIHHAGRYDSLALPRSLFSVDSSFYYYHKSIQISQQNNEILTMAHAYYFLGIACEWKKDFINAVKYAKEAFKWYRKENQTMYAVEAGTRIGIAYTQLREHAKAKEWLEKTEALTDTARDIRVVQKAVIKQWLGIHYQEKGDWKRAAGYQRQHYELLIKDIQFYRDRTDEGARLLYESELKEAKLEDEKKELQLALSVENHRRQMWLNVFICFLLVGTAVAGIVYYRLFRKYKETSRQNAELVKEQSHRIKNNLQSLYDLLTLQLYDLSDPKAIEALEESLTRINAMALIHRRLYDGGKLEKVELATFIPDLVTSALRSYHLDVEVSCRVDPVWLHADNAITLALIINELTTNACKYAFEENSAPALDITCHLEDQEIYLTFKDNGPGFTTPSETSAFGLRLIAILVKKLHGKSSFVTDDGCLFKLSFKLSAKSTVGKKDRAMVE